VSVCLGLACVCRRVDGGVGFPSVSPHCFLVAWIFPVCMDSRASVRIGVRAVFWMSECWIIQESTKLSPVHHMMDWILEKKKVIAARNLKDWPKFTTPNGKNKMSSSHFSMQHFDASLNNRLDYLDYLCRFLPGCRFP